MVMAQLRRPVQLKTVLAFALLIVGLVLGVWVDLSQRARADPQVEAIDFSFPCSITGGHVVEQPGGRICADDEGWAMPIP